MLARIAIRFGLATEFAGGALPAGAFTISTMHSISHRQAGGLQLCLTTDHCGGARLVQELASPIE